MLSLRWPIIHDASTIHTVAYYVDRLGLAPYRDLFEASMPLSYLVHIAVGRLLGYDDIGVRIADVGMLLALSVVTWRTLRPLGRLPALAAPALFALILQGWGATEAFQREFHALLPLGLAIWLASGVDRKRLPRLYGASPALRYGIIGLLLGLVLATKPNYAVLPPVVVVYAVIEQLAAAGTPLTPRSLLRPLPSAVLWSVAGAAISFSLPLLWVWQRGGIVAFADIVTNYWPFYGQLDTELVLRPPFNRFLYRSYWVMQVNGKQALLVPVAVGAFGVLFGERFTAAQKRQVLFWLVLLVACAIGVFSGGRFIHNRWIPFLYAAASCMSVVLMLVEDRRATMAARLFALLVFAFSVLQTVRPSSDTLAMVGVYPAPDPFAGNTEALTQLFQTELQAGDTVQVITPAGNDFWKAFRTTNAPLATRHFFGIEWRTDITSPVTRRYQRQYLAELQRTRPRYLIEMVRPGSLRASERYDFPELGALMESDYTPVLVQETMIILERRE